jgi:glutamine synthetase
MSTLRFQALKETFNRKPVVIDETLRRSELFGKNVFNETIMRQFLTKEAYKSVIDANINGSKISRGLADHISTGMKEWAISKGVTHYTHWFQPLTGSTAEKHDAFFETIGEGLAIEKFAGNQLVQQEPDASSFPHGGIRNTFEARGYTAWDPTSPAFILGTTLCIPTVFVSYTGEALDYKTPLLRALQSLDTAATAVAKYFDKNVSKVIVTLGWEQEYFLIDSALYLSRPDLQLSGRTLLGHSPAKGQQLDDHYFGSIPSRALAYMRDLEIECMLLGIPVKTRHNEVAPNQFELAPIFEECNLAVDHNSLLMDLMDKVAERHNFKVLFHEKPFAGINGSGKHNNWSLSTNTGINLLGPGTTPMKNLQFLTFFINTIKALHDNEELVRATIASASNDHRLGANEAPPAIISAFIGTQLTEVLNELEKVTDGKLSPQEKTELKLNVVGKIPEILMDNTDRNRTSTFAFTGNKFELRACGSEMSIGLPLSILNGAVADVLNETAEFIEKSVASGMSADESMQAITKKWVDSCYNVIFNGDGYSEAWVVEAQKRGLLNLRTTADSLPIFQDKKATSFLTEQKIFTNDELETRFHVLIERYNTIREIEFLTLIQMINQSVIPAIMEFKLKLGEVIRLQKEISFESSVEKAIYKKLNYSTETLFNRVENLTNGMDLLPEDGQKRSKVIADTLMPLSEEIAELCNDLEEMVPDHLWPLPKYYDMLFLR